MVDRGEPVRLPVAQPNRRAKWRRLHGPPFDSPTITVGELDDGRWYVDVLRPDNQPARAYPTKAAAWRVVRNWMLHLGGEWERIPAIGGTPHGWVGERITVTQDRPVARSGWSRAARGDTRVPPA